jgi:hypothetical protein
MKWRVCLHFANGQLKKYGNIKADNNIITVIWTMSIVELKYLSFKTTYTRTNSPVEHKIKNKKI